MIILFDFLICLSAWSVLYLVFRVLENWTTNWHLYLYIKLSGDSSTGRSGLTANRSLDTSSGGDRSSIIRAERSATQRSGILANWAPNACLFKANQSRGSKFILRDAIGRQFWESYHVTGAPKTFGKIVVLFFLSGLCGLCFYMPVLCDNPTFKLKR